MNSILLVDDDTELCEMLKQYLEAEGFSVTTVHDGEQALVSVRTGDFDLVLLDVMMPVMNGFDVLRELRRSSSMPVLMLTARGDDVDSIIGLELGADDYLPKPCNPRVLVARIRAILRRADSDLASAGEAGEPLDLTLGDLELHAGTRKVVRGAEEIEMTSTEFALLELLLRNAGHVVTKSELSEHALGRELSRYDRSVDMHVSNLRKKLGPLENGDERIKTVRGVGYQYVNKG
jgi:two-component system response regulator CpxR